MASNLCYFEKKENYGFYISVDEKGAKGLTSVLFIRVYLLEGIVRKNFANQNQKWTLVLKKIKNENGHFNL